LVHNIFFCYEALAYEKILGKWVLENRVDDFLNAFHIKNTVLTSQIISNKGPVIIEFSRDKTFEIIFQNDNNSYKISVRGIYSILNNVKPQPITFSKITKIRGSRHFIIKINSTKNNFTLSYGSIKKRLRPLSWSKDKFLRFNFISKSIS